MNPIYVFVLALFALVSCWYGAPYVLRLLQEARLERICRSQRAIVLTYDDGPGVELTRKLLNLLDGENVKATFFVLGRNVERAPDVVRQLVESGHEVGNHTYDHTNAWRSLPGNATVDLQRGIDVVARHGGNAVLFRPPYGKITLVGLIESRRRGLRFGWWTVDSGDSWARRPISDIVNEIEAKGGGVVLMHDFDRYGDSRPTVSHVEYVLALTEAIIRLAKRNDYSLRTLRQVYSVATQNDD